MKCLTFKDISEPLFVWFTQQRETGNFANRQYKKKSNFLARHFIVKVYNLLQVLDRWFVEKKEPGASIKYSRRKTVGGFRSCRISLEEKPRPDL